MIAALLLLAAQFADEAVPAPSAPIVAAVAEDDLREFAALAGRRMAGRQVGGPYARADKVLLLGRDTKGFPVVSASLGFPARQSLPAPPPGTLAIIRIHQRSETIVPGPTADDFAFVAAHRIPLFVVGEWARPAPMWEVAWLDGALRYRPVGEVGEIGPWRE